MTHQEQHPTKRFIHSSAVQDKTVQDIKINKPHTKEKKQGRLWFRKRRKVMQARPSCFLLAVIQPDRFINGGKRSLRTSGDIRSGAQYESVAGKRNFSSQNGPQGC